ncbi:SpaH/EbpB family LPXTG-anchored major pilin [Streptococcus henryi]|uniref:SpaH/EbpB family LPXTG-anchored major pilin n=1 Tax=Streptococcus henryi TaxID=439219 RepID=UPI000367DD74|nr:SpaH/EbpB family LPXTG-anchored major pilin [Streptococcus henryi]
MKKIVQHILTILATLTMVLGSLGSAATVFADDYPDPADTYDIVLTKVKLSDLTGWPKQTGVDNTAYTGQKLTIADYFGTKATTLQGAYFEVRKDSATGDIVDEGLTAADGTITFKDLPAGTYFIVENKAKSEIPGEDELANAAAVPIEITLPVFKATGGWYKKGEDAVHVYPKNTVDKPTIDKVVNDNDKHDTADLGQIKTFKVTSVMPEGIKDYKLLKFEDKFSAGLTYENNLKVTLNDAAVDAANYTVNVTGTAGAKITVDFAKTFIASLNPADTVVITYDASINEAAVLGAENPNEVKVVYATNPDFTDEKEQEPGENPELHTGGKRFVKVDKKLNKKLPGAEFVVKNAAGKFLKQTGNVNTWVDSQDEATKFTSGSDGAFEVKGLAYGTAGQAANVGSTDYFLVETKAPEGYALLTQPIQFTVNATSYQADPTDLTAGLADPQEVNNMKVTIPQTGGIGSVAIVAAGMLVAGLGLMLKRRMAK